MGNDHPLDRVSMMFGKRCIRYSVPGVDKDGRQWLYIDFEDGTKLSGWGRTAGEALRHLLARSYIRAVE